MSTGSRTNRPPSAYRVEIVRRRCTGVGTCVEHAPRVFDIDDDAVAIVRSPNGNPDEKILAAAQACPTDAIVLYEIATGTQVWPLPKKG